MIAYLMDTQLPELEVIERTRPIRGRHGREPMMFFAMTATIFKQAREQFLQARMNDFYPKPVDPNLLFATLTQRAWQDLSLIKELIGNLMRPLLNGNIKHDH